MRRTHTSTRGLLTLSAVGILLLFLSEGSQVHGTPLRDEKEHEAHLIRKRNAWWSKKSTGIFDSLPSENEYRGGEVGAIESDPVSPLDCYTNKCVTEFVWCGRNATPTQFLRCKLSHRICARRCFGGSGIDVDTLQ